MIKDKFKLVEKNETFIRISTDHILNLFVGIDVDGKYAFEIRGINKIIEVKSTASLKIKELKYLRIEGNVMRVTLNDVTLFNMFCTLIEDLVELTTSEKNEEKAYKVLISRLQTWKYFFKESKEAIMSENQVMGLIGELQFLKNELIHEYGGEIAIKSWSGCKKTHKDFSIEDKWYEIKTKLISKNEISISSIEQLDCDNQFKGCLVVFSLEKVSANAKCIKLNSLVMEICEMLDNDIDSKKIFLENLRSTGYSAHEEYDNLGYYLKGTKYFKVNEAFPKITRDTLDLAITGVTYKLNINFLSEHEIEGWRKI